jgi:hypothetical protein
MGLKGGARALPTSHAAPESQTFASASSADKSLSFSFSGFAAARRADDEKAVADDGRSSRSMEGDAIVAPNHCNCTHNPRLAHSGRCGRKNPPVSEAPHRQIKAERTALSRAIRVRLRARLSAQLSPTYHRLSGIMSSISNQCTPRHDDCPS